MKKIYLLIVGISIFTSAFSQFTYGPKLGANTAKFANDKIMPGFQLGGFLNGEFEDRIGIQVDFLWTLKGNHHVEDIARLDSLGLPTSSKITTSTKTYYRFVDIPFCLYFPVSKHIRGFVGPQISVARKAHQKYDNGSTVTESNITGITTKTSFCAGFDFVFNSPVIIGVRFVSNKFNQPLASSGLSSSGTTSDEVQKLYSVMINIAYKMDW